MSKYLSIILLSLATLIAVPSYGDEGFNKAHLKQYLETMICKFCSLQGVEFVYLNDGKWDGIESVLFGSDLA